MSEISVSLAIPILLFSSNFLGWLKHSRTTFISFFLGVVSVVFACVIAYLIFNPKIEDSSKVAGMMIGVYTGGTPNLSAVGLGLSVKKEVFVLLNSADIVFSGIYFLFLITLGKKLISKFLPRFISIYNPKNEIQNNENTVDKVNISNSQIKTNPKSIIISIGSALGILSIAAGISMLFLGKMAPAIIILIITTLGIGASFIKQAHNLNGTYQTAEYLLLIFAVAMGSLANFSDLIQGSSAIFYFCGFVLISSVLMHFLMAGAYVIFQYLYIESRVGEWIIARKIIEWRKQRHYITAIGFAARQKRNRDGPAEPREG